MVKVASTPTRIVTSASKTEEEAFNSVNGRLAVGPL
jgi:hypothetical protein